MTLLILNDVHIGVQRSGGTTPASSLALKEHVLSSFRSLVFTAQGDLLLNGDLFDTFNINIADVLTTYKILSDWLNRGTGKLYNVAGNHDLSRTSTTLSSFQFLGRLLTFHFPGQYVHIEEAQMTPYGYVIPHVPNQSLFDMELAKVPDCDALFIHCNIDNHFAAQSDQSLNMTLEQVEACPARQIICAHEHHERSIGKVLLPGNQIATSVADWLPKQNKFFLQINDGVVTKVECAVREQEFIELDWRSLQLTDHKFVRVSGTAEPGEVAGAITTVNKFRQKSQAFVVTNAIKTQADDSNTEVFSQSLESVQAFSVLEALRRIMTEDEMKVIEGFPHVART